LSALNREEPQGSFFHGDARLEDWSDFSCVDSGAAAETTVSDISREISCKQAGLSDLL